MARSEGDRLQIYRDALAYFGDLLPDEDAQSDFAGALRRLVEAYEQELHATALAMSYARDDNGSVDAAKARVSSSSGTKP